MRGVTQKQLAEQLDLSPSSVSRALAGDPRISDETRERVKEAAARRGYRPNRLATSFRKGSTHTIGLIVIDISYPLYSGLARAVEDCAYEQGYNIILCDSDGTPEKEALYLEVLQSKQVDGILMTPLTEDARQSLHDTGRPYVLVDAYGMPGGPANARSGAPLRHPGSHGAARGGRRRGVRVPRRVVDQGHRRPPVPYAG
jgi:DNA-binding LacI/PurR family transcriptional regulator